MNAVSDLNLALAVHEAGCLPGFVDTDLESAKKFKDITGNNNLSILTTLYYIQEHHDAMEIMLDIRPRFIDFSISGRNELEGRERLFINHCKKQGISINLKSESIMHDPAFSMMIIKGKDAAGRGNLEFNTREMFLQQREAYPDMPVIPAGGITTSEDIDWYLERGAAAVSIGTAFALTQESSISEEVKHKMLMSDSGSLVRIGPAARSGIILGEVEVVEDDNNYTDSLRKGVQGQGGHIYAGHGIDRIEKISTVRELVDSWISSSKYLSRL
jgi:hypothetical protein